MYHITQNGSIRDDVNNIIIPNEPKNRDFIKYQKWLTAGNTALIDTISLSDYKTSAKIEIDNISEAKKMEFITPGMAKNMAYADKHEEAVDFKAAGYPVDATPYPYINQESIQTGDTPTVVTDRIIAAKTISVDKFSQVEGFTIAGKRNIDSAVNETAVDTVKNSTITSIQGIV